MQLSSCSSVCDCDSFVSVIDDKLLSSLFVNGFGSMVCSKSTSNSLSDGVTSRSTHKHVKLFLDEKSINSKVDLSQ